MKRIYINTKATPHLEDVGQNGFGSIATAILFTGGVTYELLSPLRRLMSSRFFPRTTCGVSQSILKKLDQFITSMPRPLLILNACSGVLIAFVCGIQAVAAAGLGIGALFVGSVCEMALCHDKIRTDDTNDRARTFIGLGTVLSPLLLIASFNWTGFVFGLGQGILWSSLILGLGSRVKVN